MAAGFTGSARRAFSPRPSSRLRGRRTCARSATGTRRRCGIHSQQEAFRPCQSSFHTFHLLSPRILFRRNQAKNSSTQQKMSLPKNKRYAEERIRRRRSHSDTRKDVWGHTPRPNGLFARTMQAGPIRRASAASSEMMVFPVSASTAAAAESDAAAIRPVQRGTWTPATFRVRAVGVPEAAGSAASTGTGSMRPHACRKRRAMDL